jgi:hypothetical protein
MPRFNHMELTLPPGVLSERRREEVDALLEKTRKWRDRDPRVEIKEYEDLEIGGTTVHAFYVRHLLPIWFDVQVIETEPGATPARRWRFE